MYNLNRQNIRNNNLKKRLYIAKVKDITQDDNGNEKVVYFRPEKYYFNVMPLKEQSDIQAFGERAISTRVAVIREKDKYLNEFKDLDVAYLEGATPNGELEYGDNANYYVYAVSPQNSILKVYFSKLVK